MSQALLAAAAGRKGKDMNMAKQYDDMDEYLTFMQCDQEEIEQREREALERQRFVEGMKRYPEMGIPVYIDDEIPEEETDWDKLSTGPKESRYFYMADYIADEQTGRLKEIRWNSVCHGDIETEADSRKKRNRKRK